MNLRAKDSIFILFVVIIFMCMFSLMFVYSSSSFKSLRMFNRDYQFLVRQGIFYSIGFIGMIILSMVNYKIYKKYRNQILIFAILILLLVLIPGIGRKVNGARRWISFGVMNFQPAEFSKLFFIFYFSYFLEKTKKLNFKDFEIIVPGILLLLPFAFLTLLEKDLGTAIHYVVIASSMLYISDIKLSILSLYAGCSGVVLFLMAIINKSRLARLVSFFNSIIYGSSGQSYQLRQSLIGIGNGGIMGRFIGNSGQKYFYLPESHTDFIFSIISEEGGLVFSITVIILYIIIFIIGLNASINCKDLYGKYLAFGITMCIVSQAIINIMVVTALIPATGIPLPLLSHGGSSVICSLLSIGVLINIIRKGAQ